MYVILTGALTINALTSGLKTTSHNLSTTIKDITKSATPTKNTAQNDDLTRYAENLDKIFESCSKVWLYVLKT